MYNNWYIEMDLWFWVIPVCIISVSGALGVFLITRVRHPSDVHLDDPIDRDALNDYLDLDEEDKKRVRAAMKDMLDDGN